MKKFLKVVFILLLVYLFIKALGSESGKKGMEAGRVTAPSANTEQVEQKELKPLEKINSIVSKVSNGSVEAIVFHDDDLATDENPPYNVVINFPLNYYADSCDSAKRLSYYLIEALFADKDSRAVIQRVLVSMPSYLRTSLGVSDGVPMVEKGTFSGPSNYWKVMSDPRFSSEDEDGNLEDRTWGVLFDRCKQ